MFKVGDKVKVVKKVEEEDGWLNGWIDDMDDFLGKTFTIDSIDEYGIGFKGLPYEFPPSSLELVTEELQSANQKRHRHADIIHAWAEGADIEIKNEDGIWVLQDYPVFFPRDQYRIKPKEPEWWENIPEHGILIRRIGTPDMCAIAYSRLAPNIYEKWEPLTNEELERFKR